MQTSQHNLLLMDLTDRGLTIGLVVLFSVGISIAFLLKIPFLPLLLISIPVLIYICLKSVQLPFIMICAICAGSYLGNVVHIIEEGAIPFSPFQIFYLLGLVFFITGRFISANFRILVTRMELELLLLYSVVFFHCAYSPNPEFGFFFAGRMVFLSMIVYLIINSITTYKQLNIIMWIIIGVAFFMAIVAILDLIVNPEVAVRRALLGESGRLAGRARIGQKDPNIFATFFFFPIAFLVSIIVAKTKKHLKVVALIVLPVFIISLLTTFSRSAWVSTVVMLVVVALIYRQYKFFGYAALIIAIIFLSVPALREILFDVVSRLSSLFSGSVDDSNRMRLLLVSWSLNTFFDNYMLGIGFGGYGTAFNKSFDRFETLGVTEAHNEILLIIVEMGIIGLIVYSMLVFRVLQTAYYNIKNSSTEIEKAISVSLFSALVAFAIFYQFIAETLTDNNIWILTGFVFTVHLLQKKSASNRITKTSSDVP